MRITVCDVAPRDGLQNQPVTLAPEVRAELVDRLAGTGVPRVEAVSFVSPKHVPQMAEAEEVVAAIHRRNGVVYAGLALNERGYDRLHDSGLDEVHFALAASEEFNRRNAGASVEEGMAAGERIVARAKADGIRATVNIATEDLVYLLHGEGAETGIELEALIEVAKWLETQLGRELEGQVYKAGTFAPVAS